MKYIRQTKEDIKEDFLFKLLNERNILSNDIDQEKRQLFLRPTKQNEHSSTLLDHIDEAAHLLYDAIIENKAIRIYIDPDVDGYTSAALLYNYITEVLKVELVKEINLSYHIPDGKEHGLKTVMKELTDTQICNLIIMPDSSSNDYEEHKTLKEMGYDILVLDHHEADHYSENAVVVNNQLSKDYPNKSLSGVGVVYKFLERFEELYLNGKTFIKNYIDLVALGQISDMMDMNTFENRYICSYGLSHINNQFFNELVLKQSFSIGENLTQIGIAFYITPLINALIRVGNNIEKERLFEAFIDPFKKVPSTKRGEKGKEETICVQSVRNCVNAKSRQNREKDKAIELLNIQVAENCLNDNKILILNADDLDVSNTLTGLCAMGVAAEYKKPVMLGRVSTDGYLKGSIRGREESELKDFRGFLLKSGYMDYVEGHNNAAGFSIKVSDIPKLYEYANKELADINFYEGFYEADFVVNGNCSYLTDLILQINEGKEFWGQGNKEPIVIVENIITNSFQAIGANKDTVKFQFNGIEYIKFKDKQLANKLENIKKKVSINIAGKCSVNTWGGKEKPQILIEEIEIKELSDNDF